MMSRLRDKNLVFTVTAGRTGTLFLKRLFATLPDTTSLHEPEPAFHRYLRSAQRDPSVAREFLLRYKLPFIGGLRTTNYVELSNVFCKGYLLPLLELGITPNLIIMRREPRKIAVSYLERYSVPGRTHFGLEYLLDPALPGVLPLPSRRRMSDYQIIFWYTLEIERRQRDYARLVADLGGAVCDVTAQELTDVGVFFELAQTLGLLAGTVDRDKLAAEHAAISARGHNRTRRQVSVDGDIDAQEQEVYDAISAVDPGLRSWIEAVYRDRKRPSWIKRRTDRSRASSDKKSPAEARPSLLP
jgi:hypothetical protein